MLRDCVIHSYIFEEKNISEYNSLEISFIPGIENSLSIYNETQSNDLFENHIKLPIPFEQFQIDTKENKADLPEFYSIDKIKDEYIKDPDIKNLLNEDNITRSILNLLQYKFIELAHKRGVKKDLSVEIKNDKDDQHKKRGQTKKSKSLVTHDKMSSDNILKKIKAVLLNKYIINFLNEIIKLKLKEYKLVKLDYKYINELKKENELNYLMMRLKEIFSMNISTKYSKFGKDYNKKIIEHIINKDDSINFIFNLTYNDFIDLFTHKKKIEDIKVFNIKLDNKSCEEIKKYFPKVESFYRELKGKNDIKYSTLVIFYLFNLERVIKLKQNRNKK